MKKIIAMVLLSLVALVAMATAAAALQTSNAGVTGRVDSGRHWGCAGNDDLNQAVCVEDPVPTAIRVG